MALYLKTISDKEILEQVKDSEKISIIGCGMCANISLGKDSIKNKPFINIFLKPLAIIEEMDRIKQLIENDNRLVECNYIKGGLCKNSLKNSKKINRLTANSDTILTLGCFGGIKTVKNAVVNKEVIMCMRYKDMITTGIKLKGTKVYLDKSKTLLSKEDK